MSNAKSAQKALYRALKDGSFEPAYYFHGDEEFLKDGAVRDFVRRATDPATRDFNLEVRRGGDTDGAALSSLLATPPMMAERRVVVVRDVGALKKDARASLERYLAAPAPDVVLLLVATSGSKPDRGLEKGAVSIPFDALTGDRVPRWIAHHAKEAFGAEISPEATALLHAAVGDDLHGLAGELQKLAALAAHRGTPGHPALIDETAVGEIVGIRRGETMADLLDRVAERDAPGALALVTHVLSQPKASGVTLVMALTAQTLAIGWGRAAMAAGLSASRLEQGYFELLTEKSVFTGRPWRETKSAWARAATNGRWTDQAIDEALDALLAADIALKQTGVSSEDQIVIALVLAMCASAAPRRAGKGNPQ